MNNDPIFTGCIPALMTPCNESGEPDFIALAKTGKSLIEQGMRAVVYCGSMGDWPLLSLQERKQGVEALIAAGVPTVVGTGAQNTQAAAELASHAAQVGAEGLMIIPRLLSRATSVAAQRSHFSAVLNAAPQLPSVIYNSPYYGFETKADLFFELRSQHQNLVGFKEFGGAEALSYAAEHITSGDPGLSLMIGVDTQVVHGFVRCGAVGAITGVGNALPKEILHFASLCEMAVNGDSQALLYANELDNALSVLSEFDEGPDLVLYYKHLMVLEGHSEYQHHFNHFDCLTVSQKAFITEQWHRFKTWWSRWPGNDYQVNS
ncbi:MAG: dihydrodipicolinate synthase family protein [Marinicella sp.]